MELLVPVNSDSSCRRVFGSHPVRCSPGPCPAQGWGCLLQWQVKEAQLGRECWDRGWVTLTVGRKLQPGLS